MWEDYAVKNWDRFVELFGLIPFDIHTVAWMIEHHLPWGVKKAEKRKALAQTVNVLGIADVYTSVLVADTWGRISDDGPEKKEKVLAWIGEFLELVGEQPDIHANVLDDMPTLIMPIAPSGAGKSTLRSLLFNDRARDIEIFSMDDLRIEMYMGGTVDLSDHDYNRAYAMSTEDKGFAQAVQNKFNECISTGKDVYCDNTNTSARRRRHYCVDARRKGYRVQAILLPIDLDTLTARQTTRTDKTVPEHAVRAQYMGTQMPSYGDFDSIIVIDSNL
jgi:predicted kinase